MRRMPGIRIGNDTVWPRLSQRALGLVLAWWMLILLMPDVPPGSTRVQSNDVTVDERGLIFLLDRVRGLHILERVG